jgi:hypothetical protein
MVVGVTVKEVSDGGFPPEPEPDFPALQAVRLARQNIMTTLDMVFTEILRSHALLVFCGFQCRGLIPQTNRAVVRPPAQTRPTTMWSAVTSTGKGLQARGAERTGTSSEEQHKEHRVQPQRDRDTPLRGGTDRQERPMYGAIRAGTKMGWKNRNENYSQYGDYDPCQFMVPVL